MSSRLSNCKELPWQSILLVNDPRGAESVSRVEECELLLDPISGPKMEQQIRGAWQEELSIWNKCRYRSQAKCT